MHRTIVIRPGNYIHSNAFNEIAEAFDDALFGDPAKRLVFGAHLLDKSSAEHLRGRIIYQTEQITTECKWLTPDYIDTLKQYDVWDYSKSNIEALSKLGITAKHVPVRYMPCMTKFESKKDNLKDIDVLFYGSTNPRRIKILNDLIKAGVRVEKLFGVYGLARDHFISKSKIVLNLHYFENGIFEIFRCAHLFANSKCVISEWGCDHDLDAQHMGSAAFFKTEDIVDACLRYLKDDNKRHAQESAAFEAFKFLTLEEEIV